MTHLGNRATVTRLATVIMSWKKKRDRYGTRFGIQGFRQMREIGRLLFAIRAAVINELHEARCNRCVEFLRLGLFRVQPWHHVATCNCLRDGHQFTRRLGPKLAFTEPVRVQLPKSNGKTSRRNCLRRIWSTLDNSSARRKTRPDHAGIARLADSLFQVRYALLRVSDWFLHARIRSPLSVAEMLKTGASRAPRGVR